MPEEDFQDYLQSGLHCTPDLLGLLYSPSPVTVSKYGWCFFHRVKKFPKLRLTGPGGNDGSRGPVCQSSLFEGEHTHPRLDVNSHHPSHVHEDTTIYNHDCDLQGFIDGCKSCQELIQLLCNRSQHTLHLIVYVREGSLNLVPAYPSGDS